MKAFSEISRLRLLKINNVQLSKGPEDLSNKLGFLEWHSYPSKSLPASLQVDELVELHMANNSLKQLWYGCKSAVNLKIINLRNSLHLIKTPDFTGIPNLESLILEATATATAAAAAAAEAAATVAAAAATAAAAAAAAVAAVGAAGAAGAATVGAAAAAAPAGAAAAAPARAAAAVAAASSAATTPWVLVRNLTCFSLKIFVSFCSWFWFGVIRFIFYYVWIFFLNLG
ncbi:hypothetical protein NC651_037199 [Populus alba x Populus x berolinensis]|nr:hypothetical protein NC651_037199 [Populus alba x Populus x berolinensis]